MQIFVLDSDFESLKIADDILGTYPKYKKKCFTKDSDLLQAARVEKPDIVMINGDENTSAKTIKALNDIGKSIKIVVTSENKEMAMNAFDIGAFGFILKPLTEEKISNQLFHMKHPILSKL